MKRVLARIEMKAWDCVDRVTAFFTGASWEHADRVAERVMAVCLGALITYLLFELGLTMYLHGISWVLAGGAQ